MQIGELIIAPGTHGKCWDTWQMWPGTNTVPSVCTPCSSKLPSAQVWKQLFFLTEDFWLLAGVLCLFIIVIIIIIINIIVVIVTIIIIIIIIIILEG